MHLISEAVVANANADMLDRCDKELGKRVSFIFGDGQRNLATAAQRVSFVFGDGQRNLSTACATCIFYLWLWPAQLGDGRATRIFYLWRRPAQFGDGPRKAHLLSLATASASWRRPAQRVSFIFDDGQRNLATARSTRIFYLW